MEIIRQLAEDIGADTALKLMDMFKSDADKRIQAIREYQANGGERADLRMQAHSLKGLCRTYGATQAGNVAMALQVACDEGDDAAIPAKVQDALDIIPGEVDAVINTMRDLAAASQP
jgi:HPt (histidine-containing phosphotransfer) domain-containing protein